VVVLLLGGFIRPFDLGFPFLDDAFFFAILVSP